MVKWKKVERVMLMKKLYSLFLVLAMCLSLVPPVYADSLGEIDLSTDGRVCITDTGYITNYDGTYDSSNEIRITDEYYRITGTIGGDTPIEIRNNSDTDTELSIFLNNVDIQTDALAKAISIYNNGTGDLKINLTLDGNNKIISEGYPPFFVANGSNVSIAIVTTNITYDYTFYNSQPSLNGALFNTNGAVTSFTLDGLNMPNEAVDTVGHTCSSQVINYNDAEHRHSCDHYSIYHNELHDGTATCTAKAHCSVCNQDYGEIDANAHNWGTPVYENDTEHKYVCSYDSNHTYTEVHEETVEAYCSTPAYCTICNSNYGAVDANNHDWSEWMTISATEHKRECYLDPVNHYEIGNHSYVGNKCVQCGYPKLGAYANAINGDIVINTDNGSDSGITWTTTTGPNGESYYRVIELNNVIILGDLFLPNTASPDEEIIEIKVTGDCRVIGAIVFDNNSYRTETTISGDGSLDISTFVTTGNGDRLNIHADTEIDDDLFLGASGGMDSHLEISGATLEVDGSTTLIEELELKNNAEFIMHGNLSMHNTPVFNIADGCEIQIMGDGMPSFYVESSTEPSWYNTLVYNKTLPIGYSMKVDNVYNYFCLHDENDNVVTGAVTLKNKPNYNITVASEVTKCTYTVTTGMNGANSVYTIEDDTVVLDVVVTDTDYHIGKVEKVVGGTHTELTATQPGKYEIIMPASDVQFVIILASNGSAAPTPPQPQPSTYSDPSYKIEIEDMENGEIKSNYKYAESGDTVKLTIIPDTGYILHKLTVLDKRGKEIEVDKDGDIYKFRMPSGKVVVSGEFINSSIYHSENCDRGESCPIWRFNDTNAYAWYHDGVHYCIDDEIMVGYDDRIFKPDAPITRAMLVTMLWRLEGEPYVNYLMQFEDVDLGQWYTEAIRWASSERIAVGYSSKEFGYNDIVTREQMITILYRYAQYKDMDVSVGEDTNILSYNDIFDVAEYAIPAMQWACGEGIVKGDNGNLMPKDSTTRSQFANILFRYFKLS